jgi:CRISPR-associated protein Cmr2
MMATDYFAELGRAGGRFPDLKDMDAVTTCYHILVATGHKKDKDTGADALRAVWGKSRLHVPAPEPDTALWQPIAAPTVDLTTLPVYSFALHFTFTLAQPYLSKDDNAFYIVDNPIVRDKVFRLPLVRPSGWKGSLRAALWQLGYRHDGEKYEDERVQRMFGEIRGDDTGQAGLIFYPTFFTETSLEIINPHDRVRRVGKNPILFESVPVDASGRFTLLYVPFDRVGQDEGETKLQLAQDLPVLAAGLQAMFTVYGFSAKRTSGFGLAQETVSEGTLTLRIAGPQTAAPPLPEAPSAPAQDLPRYLEAPGRLKAEYLTPDGRFRDRSEAELKVMKKADRQLYDKAKAWWEREGKTLAEQGPQPEPAVAVPPPATAPAWPSWEFASFDALVALADQVAQQLTRGGA